jgi:CHAT domain-containing protein
VWVPDDALHGFPIAALRRQQSYLIEHFEVVHGFSGALHVHQATHPRRWAVRRHRALVVSAGVDELRGAAREGEEVAAALFRARRLHGQQATRAAVQAKLASARLAHFACHAYFMATQPLAGYVRLPSGENWRLLEWMDEPVCDLPLVTLSACRSAEVGRLLGSEVFGLVPGALAAGVRAVLAGLWPVVDQTAPDLMCRFYYHRLTADLGTALARAQREILRIPGSSPLHWAVFALFGDATSLPAPGLLGGLWGRWRQSRLGRRSDSRHKWSAEPRTTPW